MSIINNGYKSITKCKTCGCDYITKAKKIERDWNNNPVVRCPQCSELNKYERSHIRG